MKKKYLFLLWCIVIIYVGCTEPFTVETYDFEDLLVVESTLSSELKIQKVKLSRTTELESFRPNIENNAIVTVNDDLGNIFNFSQDDETGEYYSNEKFKAFPNIAYQLNIKTLNGEEYSSNEIYLPPTVEITNLYAESSDETSAVEIYIDTYSDNANIKYYRYEYEETYKVTLPYPTNWSWELTNYDFRTDLYEINLTRKEPNRYCYYSNNSSGIIQAATNNLSENNIVRQPIHFIWGRKTVIRDRYSILVKQYVQSPEAYTFYKITQDLGNVESQLSESQPGFVQGNIYSKSNPSEKVLGFFEVSSVASKRIYFNYEDFGFEKPEYFNPCEVLVLQANSLFKKLLEVDNFEIYDYRTGGLNPIPRYIIYKNVCTDCNSPGASKIKPDFWED